MGLLDKMRSGGSGRTPSHRPKTSYGIEQAAELLRSLPKDNMDLVFTVVKKTLESFNVDVSSIVDDAEAKLARLEKEMKTFKNEIEKYEKEIAERRSAITILEEELEETSIIKEHLEELRAVSDMGQIPDYARKKMEEDEAKAKAETAEMKPLKAADKDEPSKSESSFFKKKRGGSGEMKKVDPS